MNKRTNKRKKLRLTLGAVDFTPINDKGVVIELVQAKKGCWLWIGNDTNDITDSCFATVSGNRRLRKFAKAIIKASKE